MFNSKSALNRWLSVAKKVKLPEDQGVTLLFNISGKLADLQVFKDMIMFC